MELVELRNNTGVAYPKGGWPTLTVSTMAWGETVQVRECNMEDVNGESVPASRADQKNGQCVICEAPLINWASAQ